MSLSIKIYPFLNKFNLKKKKINARTFFKKGISINFISYRKKYFDCNSHNIKENLFITINLHKCNDKKIKTVLYEIYFYRRYLYGYIFIWNQHATYVIVCICTMQTSRGSGGVGAGFNIKLVDIIIIFQKPLMTANTTTSFKRPLVPTRNGEFVRMWRLTSAISWVRSTTPRCPSRTKLYKSHRKMLPKWFYCQAARGPYAPVRFVPQARIQNHFEKSRTLVKNHSFISQPRINTHKKYIAYFFLLPSIFNSLLLFQ